MKPRDYQQEAIIATAKGFKEFDKQLIILPTGAGKTVVFAMQADRFRTKRNERTLFLAHRDELINQAADKIRSVTGVEPGIEKGQSHADRDKPFTVASIQTMQRNRLNSWNRDHFGFVVVDEAHHTLADSYLNTLGHFHDRAKVLGVTATPGRGDKRNLGEYYENISYEIGIVELIKRGYLSRVMIRTVPIKIDLNGIRQTAGDYKAADLSERLEPMFEKIIDGIQEFAPKRKTLVFLPLIKTSKLFVEMLRKRGISADHVDGEMEGRKDVLKAFNENRFQILSNAMLLLEGYDQPDVDCVIMLRPTRSTALYAQALGRGTRTAPHKENLLVLDFLWQFEKHNIIRPANIVAGTDGKAKAMTEISEEGGEIDLLELEAQAEDKLERALVKELENKNRRRRYSKMISLEELAVNVKKADIAKYEPTMRWHGEPPTDGQLKLLQKFKIDTEKIKFKGQASEIISTIMARQKASLATPTQMKWLTKFNHPNPSKCSFEEATKFLDEKFGKTVSN